MKLGSSAIERGFGGYKIEKYKVKSTGVEVCFTSLIHTFSPGISPQEVEKKSGAKDSAVVFF